MSKEELLVKLAFCKGISISKKWEVVRYADSIQRYEFSAPELIQLLRLKKFAILFQESWQRLTPEDLAEKKKKQLFITYLDERYPSLLRTIPQPPLLLFYKGRLDLLQRPMIGFVGARDASDYGRRLVEYFVPKLVQENFTIVSGLAKGIDSYSHHATIQSEGYTIGVVGTGVDRCYPREVYPIYAEMGENHLILSEYPNGTEPKKYHFPMRNRIIAGICQGVCVIEAKERSGSLITAQLALESGREVFAFPGDVLNGRSTGCHRMIQDGAKCVITLQDILEELPSFE